MKKLSGRIVWIVGTGYLGRVLVDACRAAGVSVLTIDSNAAAEPDLCADAADPLTYTRAADMCGEPPAAVFCCLATSGGTVGEYHHTYLGCARALREAGLARLAVFCTSTSMYGTPSERSRELGAAEEIVLGAGGCVVRPAALYGPGRCELLRRHLAGEPRLYGPPDRVLNYVHVQDAAAALLLLAVHGGQGVYGLCGESFSKEEAYRMLELVTGVPSAVAEAPPGKRCPSFIMIDSSRLRTLGWTPGRKMRDFVEASVGNRSIAASELL